MSDIQDQEPTLPLEVVVDLGPNGDLQSMTLDQLQKEQQRMLSGVDSVRELSSENLERFSAICSRLRQTQRPAGKPPGSGTRRTPRKKVFTIDDL